MGIRERIAFFRQFRQEFASTGAVQPSSRFLARAMAAPLREDTRPPSVPRRVVEMGPGTGAVTRALARTMRPHDRLDCYELNPRFARYLREQVRTAPAYEAVRDQIRVHTGAAEGVRADTSVDFVVCSIPLNNLTADQAGRILEVAFELLAGGGWFTYFEYPLLPRLRRLVVGGPERERIDAVAALKRAHAAPGTRTRFVPLNLPPARAVHVPVSPEPNR